MHTDCWIPICVHPCLSVVSFGAEAGLPAGDPQVGDLHLGGRAGGEPAAAPGDDHLLDLPGLGGQGDIADQSNLILTLLAAREVKALAVEDSVAPRPAQAQRAPSARSM